MMTNTPYQSRKKPPIQVALICESSMQPAWVLSAIAEIQQSPIMTISSVICWQESTKRNDKSPFLYKIYHHIDGIFFRTQADPQALAHVKSVLVDEIIHFVDPVVNDGKYQLNAEKVQTLKLDAVDVVIYFGKSRISGAAIKAPKYGLWALGGGYDQRHQAEGTWTVLEGTPTTSSGLWILAEDPSDDKAIYRSFASTDKISVLRNGRKYLWKTARFAYRKLVDLYQRGEQALQQVEKENHYPPVSEKYRTLPQTGTMLPLLTHLMARTCKAKLDYLFFEEQWMVAYSFDSTQFIQGIPRKNLSYLKPPPGRQWADPFPWIKDGRAYIFIEEIPSPGAKGQIAVFDVTHPLEKGQLPITVVKSDTHLSYPFLFSYQGELFLLPESYQNRTIDIYRCKKFPYEWEFHARIFDDIGANDTTLFKVDDRWWMFTNISGESFDDELFLYYAESPLGPWNPHKKNPVISDVSRARPAGNVFYYGEKIYRPSQDCSICYGYAISINRIAKLTPTVYSEEYVCRILPDWYPNLLATHTLNCHRGLIVLDGLWRRRTILGHNLYLKDPILDAIP